MAFPYYKNINKNMIAHNGYNKLVQPTKLDIHVSTVTAAMN